MSKPQPDMNTQLLMDIQEQLKWIKLYIQDLKMEMKVDIRGCKRALDMCKIGYQECAKGYQECAKGYEAVKDQCEEIDDSIMKI